MGKAKANTGLLARRPDNSAFKHQRLPVWSPMLTAHTILPFFYCMATICVKLGVCLLHSSLAKWRNLMKERDCALKTVLKSKLEHDRRRFTML
uniref:Uncharacterized protein n=1 Tax=Hucho hucho TaxID=62062 RepID=A0A4W5PER1_9TELE